MILTQLCYFYIDNVVLLKKSHFFGRLLNIFDKKWAIYLKNKQFYLKKHNFSYNKKRSIGNLAFYYKKLTKQKTANSTAKLPENTDYNGQKIEQE